MKTLHFAIVILVALASCAPKIQKNNDPLTDTLSANTQGQGQTLEIKFEKGIGHNHPSFVFWAEDEKGNYVQTLYVTRSVATGIFQHGSASSGKWKPDVRRFRAFLPVWAHKRNIKAEDGLLFPSPSRPVPDAYTGATPLHHFILRAKLDHSAQDKLNVFMEINQTWDWNEYWTNNKFPDDPDYKTSSQPAVVYKGVIDLSNPGEEILLAPIGHSHYSGKDGSINPDLSTLTTALKIVEKVTIRVLP